MNGSRTSALFIFGVPALAVGLGIALGVMSWFLIASTPVAAQQSGAAGTSLTEDRRGIIYLPGARRGGGGELDPRSDPAKGIYYFARPRTPVPQPEIDDEVDYTPVGLKDQVSLAIGRGEFISPQANVLFNGEVSAQPEEDIFLMRRGELVVKFMPDEALVDQPHLISIVLVNQDDRRSLEEPAMIDVRLYNSSGPGHIDYNRRLFLLDREGDQTVQIPVVPTKPDWHRVRMNVTTPVQIRRIQIGAVN